MQIGLWGECLARKENYVEIDKERKDAYGIPTLKVNCEWGPNELKMFEDGREQAVEMLKSAGVQEIRKTGGLRRCRVTAFTRSAPREWARIRRRAS